MAAWVLSGTLESRLYISLILRVFHMFREPARRSRHFLRRYWALQQRIGRGEVSVVKVEDPQMPADFLTKWLARDKFNLSVNYATNARNTTH